MQAEEIRAIRVGFGLSQVEFEKLLGVGPKTVVRWERGTVFQNGATDTLLRSIVEVPTQAMIDPASLDIPPPDEADAAER